MKWPAISVLLMLSFGIATPPFSSPVLTGGDQAMIGTLDVCHSAAPALSANGTGPCLQACPFCLPPPLPEAIAKIAGPILSPLAFSFPDDHPPRT